MPDPLAPTSRYPRPGDPGVTRVVTSVTDTPEPAWGADVAPGYAALYEIARGGMGRVVAARDLKLNREVAIKFLLPSLDPTAAARFVRESEITARLAHPGVPPVHALGRTPSGYPFLVMKLVHGRTLADLLGARPDPAHDLPRLVAVFEQVCQAVGYAHSQGVLHRDLKPANVMVGAFGEVQVMDWGLALVTGEAAPLPEERLPHDPAPAGSAAPHASTLTMAGTVLGTPGYMAPEQARGEAIDARADVFSLGGILAAVLTGRQPVPDTIHTYTAAADGIASAADLRAQLDAAGADPELTRLAHACLSPRPGDRPDDGKAVAEAVAAYRARAEERARRAEAEREAAEFRAAAETATRRAVQDHAAADLRARRASAGLVVALAVVVGLLGAVGWWRGRADAARQQYALWTAAGEVQAEAERAVERERAAAEKRSAREAAERNLELADDLRARFRFDEAARAIALAHALAARVEADDLTPRVGRAKAHLATTRALDAARTRQLVWVPEKNGLGRYADASGDFRQAFADAGFDPTGDDLAAVAARVAASPVRAELVAGLDDWASAEPDRALQARVLEVARLADPGPWTDRLRDVAVRGDGAAVAALAAEADPGALTPAELVALARVVLAARLDPAPVLLRAHAAHPTEFRIALHLGDAYADRDPRQAAGFYRTARALRPDNFAANNNLGVALMKAGDPAGARDAHLAAARIDPASPMAAFNLGRGLAATGDPLGAAVEFRRATRLLGSYTEAYQEEIRMWEQAGDLPAAVAAAREAVRCRGGEVALWDRLIDLLDRSGDRAGYLVTLQELAARSPGNSRLHARLGGALVDAGRLDDGIAVLRDTVRAAPGDPTAYHFLGIAHIHRRDERAAAGWLRRAAALDPTDAWIQTRLGGTLVNTDRVDEGLAALDAAVRLDPRLPTAHLFRGVALGQKGDAAGAAAAYRRAAELDPTLPRVHYNLGTTLLTAGDPAAAVAPLREATRRYATDPEAWTNLGLALARTGRPGDAADAYHTALRVRPNFPPARAGLSELERLLAP
ncbi:tetratricopeptide repeat protein [bacterium]|nr:tetratricopeptide repeat protein [bacterium]